MKIKFTQDDKFYNLYKKGDVTDCMHFPALRLIEAGVAVPYVGDADVVSKGKEYKYVPHSNGISQTLEFIRNTVEEAYA